MKMPSISPEMRQRIASAIVSLADETGETGFTNTDIYNRAACNYARVKDFMEQYGPDSNEGKNYWKNKGRKNVVTTTVGSSSRTLLDHSFPPTLETVGSHIRERPRTPRMMLVLKSGCPPPSIS